ncbi:uncharacterized protein LOC126803311 [Argentina anserina]|uniref:uncharacterized protein LOC126803311 n=1 Tax=Argentina anserina TaxID=57926 RepID=UPI00217665D8|nr:uncharacterized protein LOC126803311 [Potentilla anserina]
MEQYQQQQHGGADISSMLMKGGGTSGSGGGGEKESWGTWEELLLACAVKRHGVDDWESVAMEVQGKTSLPQLHTTAYNCKRKYHDLQRRFHQADDDPDPTIPWLPHLKNLRLAQLRQDLHRYDVSIMSLQLKVKRLEEGEKVDEDPKPDLEEQDSKRRPKGHSGSDSDKGSCETVAKKRRRQERGESGSSEAQSSASLTRKRRRELESQDQPNEQVTEKSEPLAAILQMIRAHQHGSLFERRLTSQESDEYNSLVQQHVDLETVQAKLQSQKDSSSYNSSSTLTFYRDLLLLFTNAVVFFPKSSIQSVAAHQLRRLVLSEMKKSNLITPDPSSGRSDSMPSQATVPTVAGAPLPKHELERSDSLLAKHKSTTPIIVCRKRSSISSKPSTVARKASATTDHPATEAPPNNSKKPSDSNNTEEDNRLAAAATTKEKPVTGTRSSRRTTTTHRDNNANASSAKKKDSSPAQTPKAAKKRKTPEPATASDKKRSGAAAAADFLKRIKRNSPAQQKSKAKSGTGTSTSSRGAEQKKRGGNKADNVKERVSRQSGGENKKQAKEESSPSKRSVGRPSKKAAETSAAADVVSPKRSRENGGKQQQQEASKQPKKRSRR